MTDAVLAAGIAAAASVICQVLISCRANSIVAFRLDRLEGRMDKHNNFIERMYKVEDRAKSNSHRLDDLERER